MEGSYSFNALVKCFRDSDLSSLKLSSRCRLVTYVRYLNGYLELWISCSDEEAVVDLMRCVFNDLGPIVVVGFLNGLTAELPLFLSNLSKALKYVTLSGSVELECVANDCLSLDLKRLNATKALWKRSAPNKLRCFVDSLTSLTTFTMGLRIVKPYVIPPKLLNLPRYETKTSTQIT